MSRIIKRRIKPGEDLVIAEDLVISELDRMIAERTSRASATSNRSVQDAVAGALQPTFANSQKNNHAPRTSTATATVPKQDTAQGSAPLEQAAEPAPEANANDSNGPISRPITVRDAGMSDAVWEQLQLDARKAEEEEWERRRLAEEEERLRQWLKKCADAKRQRELDEIERKRMELEEKKRQEAKAQELLAKMGVCPVGYHWIRQLGGYRCAGGSHWISDGAVKNPSG